MTDPTPTPTPPTDRPAEQGHADRIREFCDELRAAGKERPRDRDYRFMVKAADAIQTNTDAIAARCDRLQAAYRGQQRINAAYRNRIGSPKPPPQWAFDAIRALQPGDLDAAPDRPDRDGAGEG